MQNSSAKLSESLSRKVRANATK